MDEPKCGNHPVIAQIRKITSHLEARELSFVDNRFVGKGSNIKTYLVFLDRIVDGVTGVIAQYKQFAFKIIRLVDMIRAGDKHLFHLRLDTECRRTDPV